ncbi:hypothetical protein R4P70_27965 [Rhodococcus sp. IEGM 1241]|nr:hypothetical protein [Rhodococcus sp. IEGM 1241]
MKDAAMVRAPRNVRRSAGPWPNLTSGEQARSAGEKKPIPKSNYKPTERDRLAIRVTNRVLAAYHRGETGRVHQLRPLVEELVVQPPDTEVTERLRDRIRETLGWCARTLPDGSPCRFTGEAGTLYRHRATRNIHESRSARKNRVQSMMQRNQADRSSVETNSARTKSGARVHTRHEASASPPNQEVSVTSRLNPSWADAVRGMISRQFKAGEIFTSTALHHLFEDSLSDLYPKNSTIRESLSNTLQKLRDEGFLEFVDNQGTYRLPDTTPRPVTHTARTAPSNRIVSAEKRTSSQERNTEAHTQILEFSVINPAAIDESGEQEPVELHLIVQNLDPIKPSYETSDDMHICQSFGRIMRIRSKSGKSMTDVDINATHLISGPVFRVHITEGMPRSYEFYMQVQQIMKLLKSGSSTVAPYEYQILPEPSLALERKNGWYLAPSQPFCVRCRRAGENADKDSRIERIYTRRPHAIHLCQQHISEFNMQAARKRSITSRGRTII